MVNLDKIKVLAAQKKIPLGDLAAKCNITHQALNKMIRTNSTRVETLEKISNALEVPIETFFDTHDIVIVEGNHDPGAGRGNVVTQTDSEAVKLLINEMSKQRELYSAIIEARDRQIDVLLKIKK